MKLLLESWKSFLKEAEEKTPVQEEERHLGFDTEIATALFEKVRTEIHVEREYPESAGIIAAKRITKDYNTPTELIGVGSVRMAFLVNGEFVVKINHRNSQSGRTMNKDDVNLSSFTQLLPKVYDYDPDYNWIIMEKATPIEWWHEILDFFPNRLLPKYELIHDVTPYIKLFILSLKYKVAQLNGDSVEDLELEYNSKTGVFYDLFKQNNPPENQPSLKTVVSGFKSELFLSLAKLISEFGIEIMEIRPRNTGIGEDGRFLLIDSSITGRHADAG